MPTFEAVELPESEWRSLHPVLFLFGFGRMLRGYVPLLLIWTVTGQFERGLPSLFLILLASAFFLPALRLLAIFFSFRYQTSAGHLHIREGVFSRKFRSIPIHRIHNLNIKQSFAGRIFGIVQLDIETAGAAGAEASLPAIRAEEAERIQTFVRASQALHQGPAHLRSASAGEVEQGEEAADVNRESPGERVIFKASGKDLFLAGATGTKISVVFVSLLVLFQYAQDYAPGTINGPELDRIVQKTNQITAGNPFQTVIFALLLFAALVAVAWVIGVFLAFIRWHGFTLSVLGNDLQIRYGLLHFRRLVLPRNKIQALQFVVSAIRRPFNLLQIHVISAGQVGYEERGRNDANLLTPITKGESTALFIQNVWPEARWGDLDWKLVHPFHRERLFWLKCAYLLLALCGVAVFVADKKLALLVSALLVGLGIPLARVVSHLTYRETAYAVDGSFVYMKSGFLALRYWVIPRARIQNLQLRQSPLQCRRALANLELDLAGLQGESAATIPNIPLRDAWLLFNRLGQGS